MRPLRTMLFMLAAVLAIGIVRAADRTHYYVSGEEVWLEEVPDVVVAISEKGYRFSPAPTMGLTLANTLIDDNSNIAVYHSSGLTSTSRVRTMLPETEPVSIMPRYVNDNGMELTPDGYVFVKLRSEDDKAMLQRMAPTFGCTYVEQDLFMPLWHTLRIVPSAGNSSIDAANALYASGLFACAEPSFAFDGTEISYDPDVTQQWGLYNADYEFLDISISRAWGFATGRDVVIAIIDTGVDVTHPDLVNNIYPASYDATTQTTPSRVYTYHGTHCAGIAAAEHNNGIGIAGVAPEAKIMPISVDFNKEASTVISALADAINWAWINGADILSCSWSSPYSGYINDAVEYALRYGRNGVGSIIVKSAGNKGAEGVTYPGTHPKVIPVANMTQYGWLSSYSSFGYAMFITAPGSDIWSTMPDGGYANKSGTSMACPHVSGIIALMLERNPYLTVEEIKQILATTAGKVGNYSYNQQREHGSWNEHYGYGLVNAYEAIIHTARRQND